MVDRSIGKRRDDCPMEPSDLLRFVVSVLERLGTRYFITGSTVTIFYGEPRFTNDIDVVADLNESSVDTFCRKFPEPELFWLA